jgi:predicted nucleotide-binding protein (sugar kinase/HSP70/actin superfamily)
MLGTNVIRPNIAGLMGAYGAALYAKSLGLEKSSILTFDELKSFEHKVLNTKCGLCNNHCDLAINIFNGKNRYISGNRCERPITKKAQDNSLNLYEYIRERISGYLPIKGKRAKVGIPLCLNMYELYPFWYTLLTELGFEVHNSGFSTEKLYSHGQHTIPSDTECFPAKLAHGHIEKLLDEGYENIFYPGMSYNIDEKISDNHYNCPVVAYYPEQLHNNVKRLESVNYIFDYVGIHNKPYFKKRIINILHKLDSSLKKKEVYSAVDKAYEEYEKYLDDIRIKGEEIIETARERGLKIVVLCGRPYHVDPLINHGIDKLIAGFNKAVVTESSISNRISRENRHVLNQWTYHARLYNAASYVRTQKDMELVQLVSFGCGLDAITTDEVKEILEEKNKIYTQIKIDEITNLGAVKIRLRSLFAALEKEEKNEKR